MAFDIIALLTEAWLVFLLSLIFSALAFPFVFIFSFVYDLLSSKYKRAPKVLLMALVTFLAVLTAVLLLEVYAGFTLGEVAASLSPQQ